MDLEHKSLRLGAAVIAGAIVLRLLSGGILGTAVQALDDAQLGPILLFLQTGRIVRAAQPQSPEPVQQTEPAETVSFTQPQAVKIQAVFSEQDAQLVQINNTSGYDVDVAALLQRQLNWELVQDAPTVLILHTHGTESYTQTEDYTESSGYRTLDESYNVVSIGDRLAELLEAGGIRVLHDRTMHDVPSYNGSYNHSRASMEQYLADYPSICLVLDIHRDAAEDSSGNQIDYTVATENGDAAKLMLVMGTNAGGLTHPAWEENLALAVKLQAQLEKLCPDICRPLNLRAQRFNQDLSAGALLVEVGATGNTRQEALLAADYLAQGIIALATGTA